ncbi:hypothetical protein OIO90_001061 [Microbotryomycetes sp. JL221]|nr:hypothetical protein OIO90_001061 [Microbotryomycetes sp. JL221]
MASTPTTVEAGRVVPPGKIVFYRSTWFAALVLGLCNFCAPGIWGAMSSLGAGGAAEPWAVNAANALTFCLMVVTAFLTPTVVKLVGVRWTLAIGAAGYAPYAAGLYTNTKFGNQWFLLLGAALCGISAGTFWAIEAAIALTYSEPYNQGKFLGWWLSFRVGGQILGGAINLGINIDRADRAAGSVNPKVYIIFIVIQALGPFVAFLLPSPKKVQRTDGITVRIKIENSLVAELKATAKLFFSKKYLLLVPFIVQAVFSEAFNFTFIALHFSVRARALGSFLSAIVAIILGNTLGFYLDRKRISLKVRARTAWIAIVVLQGALWTWSTVIQTEFHRTGARYDWIPTELNHMFCYFLVGSIVEENVDIVRVGGLLRATESAAQAVSYGLNSVQSFSTVGSSSLNFGLWGFAILPAWLIVSQIGVKYFGRGEREAAEAKALAEGGANSSETSSDLNEKPFEK